MHYEEWLDWYYHLDAVQQKAVAHYQATGELAMVAFFWQQLPDCGDWPLPEVFELAWQRWYATLSKTQQLSVNAYRYVGNPRLLLFVWNNLLDNAQQSLEVSVS